MESRRRKVQRKEKYMERQSMKIEEDLQKKKKKKKTLLGQALGICSGTSELERLQVQCMSPRMK